MHRMIEFMKSFFYVYSFLLYLTTIWCGFNFLCLDFWSRMRLICGLHISRHHCVRCYKRGLFRSGTFFVMRNRFTRYVLDNGGLGRMQRIKFAHLAHTLVVMHFIRILEFNFRQLYALTIYFLNRCSRTQIISLGHVPVYF